MGIFGLKNPDNRGKNSVFRKAMFGPEPGSRPIKSKSSKLSTKVGVKMMKVGAKVLFSKK